MRGLYLAVIGFLAVASGNSQAVDLQLHTSDQFTAVVEGPARIKPGETAKFSIKLSPAPEFVGGRLMASFGLVEGPDIYDTGPPVVSGQSVYEISIVLSSDVPTGIWEMRNLRIFGVSEKKIQMKSKVVFDVLPATGVVYPTSAEVSINLDQKQLLRTEAARLQKRVEQFRVELTSQKRESFWTDALLTNLGDSLRDLKRIT